MKEYEILFNRAGVPVGSVRAHWRLTKKQREYCAAYVERLVSEKFKREHLMGKSSQETKEFKQVRTSECRIGGLIRYIKVQEDSAFLLIDTESDNTKWIPCSVYKDKKIQGRLERYGKDDYIAIVGFVRAFSQKKNDEWNNGMDVRVVDIKSPDPAPAQKGFPGDDDDDIPF